MSDTFTFSPAASAPFSFTVGSVTTGAVASVTNVGSGNAVVLDFVFPEGGGGGGATIEIGTVSSGSTASVTNSGTSSAAVFNFVLPKGDTGAPGTNGIGLNWVVVTAAEYAALTDEQRADTGTVYFIPATT